MSNSLPKHIAAMVEKNNLAIAIKTLASEKNISFDEAKNMIDEYEEVIRLKRIADQEKIIKRQKIKTAKQFNEEGIKKFLTSYLMKVLLILVLGSGTMWVIANYVK